MGAIVGLITLIMTTTALVSPDSLTQPSPLTDSNYWSTTTIVQQEAPHALMATAFTPIAIAMDLVILPTELILDTIEGHTK